MTTSVNFCFFVGVHGLNFYYQERETFNLLGPVDMSAMLSHLIVYQI